MTADSTAHCSTHREAVAGWRCSHCRSYLCGQCTARLINLHTCVHCGGPASMLTEPRAGKPFLTWWVDAISYPVRNIHIALLLTALAGFLAHTRAESPANPAGGLLSPATLLRIAHFALLGIAGLSILATSARRLNESQVATALRAVATTGLLWVPAAVWVFVAKQPLDDHLGAVITGLAVVYAPAALASSATDIGLDRLMSPFAVFDWIWQIKLRYLLFVFWTAFLGLCALQIGRTNLSVSGEPLVNEMASSGAAVGLLMMAARLLGSLVHVHGDAFGWGSAEQYVDPIFPDMEAIGTRKGNYGIGEEASKPKAPSKPAHPRPARSKPGGEDSEEARFLDQIQDKLSTQGTDTR